MAKKVLYISMLCERESTQHEITLTSPELADDSGKWVEMRLQELGGDIAKNYDVSYINIAQGDSLPTPETTASYDFIILGGTFHDVCSANLNPEGRDWQKPLKGWLMQQRNTGQPLLGICGGHQAMAVALGGEVTRRGSIKGIAAGSLSVTLTEHGRKHPLMQGLSKLDSDCAFHFGNGDEVSSLPPCAQVLATATDSPMIALDYGNNWMSTQFHPEASHTAFQYWVDSGVIKLPREEDKYRPLATGAILIANFLKLENTGVHPQSIMPTWPQPGSAEEAAAEAAFLALLPSGATELAEGVFSAPASSTAATLELLPHMR